MTAKRSPLDRECPARWEGGPHRWEPFDANGEREFCYYCDKMRDVPTTVMAKLEPRDEQR